MDLLLVEQTLSKLFECLLAHFSGIVHKSTFIEFLYVVIVKYQPRVRLSYVSAICFFQISNNYQQLWLGLGLAKVVSICGNITYTCIVF